MTRPAALVPVKRLDLAKTRLADALSPETRARVAGRLFAHVLSCLEQTNRFSRIAVITADETVAERALARGAYVLADPCGAPSLGAVVDAGLDALAELGETSAVVVMSDLPRLHARALCDFLDATRRGEALLAPDRDGRGSNVLYVPLPRPFGSRFAEPRSGELHRLAATAASIPLRVHEDEFLAFDLDLVEDLDAIPGWT
jgi:2-phospho-L-lactate/phosphoenolpyruvate guanylyltransferase